FLVAKLTNNNTILQVFTMSAVGGSVAVAQAGSTFTVTFNGVQVGVFVAPNLQNININSFGGYTVNTTQVMTVPVAIHDQPGDNTYLGGASDTTIFLNSGSTDTISVTGGQNALNFSPTSFGVTFDDSKNQGQLQQLDPSAQHFVSVSGIFQNIVGTGFSDTL